MQARTLPAARGWNWLVEGLRLFRANPAMLTFVVFGYWLVLVFLNVLPLVGFVLAPLCVPALSVSVMNGCRAVERGEMAPFGIVFSGFRRHAQALFLLGALYLAGSLAVLAASIPVDDGLLFEIMLGGRRPAAEAIEGSNLMAALQVALLLMVPLLMAFWFAPLLVAWDGLAPLKALFFSFVACWRNWRAFAVYGAGVAFVSAILPGILLGLFGVFSEALVRMAAVALTLPILFVFVPTLFASFYMSYRDVFSAAPAAPPAAEA